tara:strand:- start:336 stop:1088 length:753 start_codon:yes stop_codon:yes gene_type:complete
MYTHPLFKYSDYKNLKQNCSDDQVDLILDMIKKETPFSFARFNDGEMGGVDRIGASIARHDQIVNESLHNKLIESLQGKQKNYWIGVACSICFPKFRELAEKHIDMNYPHLIRACALTNRNWLKFIQKFPEAMGKRPLNWICGSNQNLNVFNDMGIEMGSVISVPYRDSWSVYEEIMPMVKNFRDGSFIGLSCGPLSRVLAKEWFEINPSLTLLDVGSVFDPFTKGNSFDCHRGWVENGRCNVKKCKECN